MIFTRRFGALRARPVFPSATDPQQNLELNDDDIRWLDELSDRRDQASRDEVA